MHEFSIAQNLIRALEQEAVRMGAKRVTSVKLKIGKLTGVVPDLLVTAFEFCSQGTVAEGAELVIEEVPLRLKCEECGNEYEVDNWDFSCPACGSCRPRILSGRELLLEKLEIELPEEGER